MRIFIHCILLLGLTSTTWAGDLPFVGHWKINYEETDKVAIKYEDGSGMQGRTLGKVNVSIMGLPLPKRMRQSPMSSLSPKDPDVLRCTTMDIHQANNKLKFEYDAKIYETLVQGNYRGRNTSWSKKKIEQKYKTTERTIKKTWTLRPDGRLLVSVKVNPRKEKARTFNRVFERYDPTLEEQSTQPPSP